MGKKTSEDLLNTLNDLLLGQLVDMQTQEVCEKAYPVIENKLIEAFGFKPIVHEIKVGDKVNKIAGITHDKFDDVLRIVSAGIPVYLTGKAGTGKNVICKQVAEALGLEFYFTNAVTQEYKLTGFIDANGIYQETQFYKAFTKGGIFFLDEMDASIPEVLVILNAAIANGYFDFPIGKVDAHPDFHVIAAGNTNGTGADINYTGRYNLDRASLDRFAMVNIDYSVEIEKGLCNNNEPLLHFTHCFRDAAEKGGVECLFSYRTIDRISKLENIIPNLREVIEMSLLKGMSEDDLHTICTNMEETDNGAIKKNKYYIAMNPKCVVPPASVSPSGEASVDFGKYFTAKPFWGTSGSGHPSYTFQF